MDSKEKGIIKKESAFVQKVSNQISITNKLLNGDFDYLKWWNELEVIWKDKFLMLLRLECSKLRLKKALIEKDQRNEDLTAIEKRMLNYNIEDIESNDRIESKKEIIQYLLKMKDFILGGQNEFVLNDLKALTSVTELEKIHFINANVKDIAGLYSLKKLKSLEITRSKISKSEIEKFKETHLDCKIIYEDLAKEYSIKGKECYENGDFFGAYENYRKWGELLPMPNDDKAYTEHHNNFELSKEKLIERVRQKAEILKAELSKKEKDGK
jgi:hypothetical protein